MRLSKLATISLSMLIVNIAFAYDAEEPSIGGSFGVNLNFPAIMRRQEGLSEIEGGPSLYGSLLLDLPISSVLSLNARLFMQQKKYRETRVFEATKAGIHSYVDQYEVDLEHRFSYFGFVPSLRWYFNTEKSLNPFVEAGLGIAYLASSSGDAIYNHTIWEDSDVFLHEIYSDGGSTIDLYKKYDFPINIGIGLRYTYISLVCSYYVSLSAIDESNQGRTDNESNLRNHGVCALFNLSTPFSKWNEWTDK